MAARHLLRGLLVGLLLLGSTVGVAVAQEAPPGDLAVELFARIGSPGQPDTVYATEDRVYVTTHNAMEGDTDLPSKLFAFTHDGTLAEEFEIEGQELDEVHGLLEIARDADGLIYLADRAPARIITIDPNTGEQATYAELADVPLCAGEPDGACSAGNVDMGSFTDGLVFAPDGTLYVTDIQQALIWRIPPGGGSAEVWLTDARFESVFGVNGNQFRADGTLLVTVTLVTNPSDTLTGTGIIYELPINEDGSPGELTPLWTSRPGDGPDGFAIAQSGRIYVALPGANAMAVISPDGQEVARIPATPVDNQLRDIPFDTPSSVTFLGTDVLLANQSIFAGDEANWAVFRIAAGEPGLPLFEPVVPRQQPAAPVPTPTATPAPAVTPTPAPTTTGSPTAAPVPATPRLPATGAGLGLAAVGLAFASRRRRP